MIKIPPDQQAESTNSVFSLLSVTDDEIGLKATSPEVLSDDGGCLFQKRPNSQKHLSPMQARMALT